MRRPKRILETAAGDCFKIYTATNAEALESKVNDFIVENDEVQILSMTTTSASYGDSNDMGVMLSTAIWYRCV